MYYRLMNQLVNLFELRVKLPLVVAAPHLKAASVAVKSPVDSPVNSPVPTITASADSSQPKKTLSLSPLSIIIPLSPARFR